MKINPKDGTLVELWLFDRVSQQIESSLYFFRAAIVYAEQGAASLMITKALLKHHQIFNHLWCHHHHPSIFSRNEININTK